MRQFLRRFRPLGLRWSRLGNWMAALKDEGARPTTAQWREIVWLTVSALWSRPPRKEIRLNYRKCRQCPFHDRTTRRCLGCGCDMPMKIAAGGRCWAKQADPLSTLGY